MSCVVHAVAIKGCVYYALIEKPSDIFNRGFYCVQRENNIIAEKLQFDYVDKEDHL